HLRGKMDIDDRRPVFRRRPAAELVAGDLPDLESGEDIVINARAEGEVELGLDRELVDFRWSEGRHAASVPKSGAVPVESPETPKGSACGQAVAGNNGSLEVTRRHVSFGLTRLLPWAAMPLSCPKGMLDASGDCKWTLS